MRLPGRNIADAFRDVSIETNASTQSTACTTQIMPGHWEGDLIGGSKNSYIATLVERHSRYVMLVKVANKDTESVVSALIKQSQRLSRELYKSISATRNHLGNADQTKTPIGYLGSICLEEPIYRCIPKPN